MKSCNINWEIIFEGKEIIGEKVLGCEFQLYFFTWRFFVFNFDFVLEFSGCLYSVCDMLDIVIGRMDLLKIYYLQLLLIYSGLV